MSNKGKNRLLTLDDLCDYYSDHKRSVNYNADKKDGAPVVVQLEGTINFSKDDYDPEIGLLKLHIRSSHIGTNRNHSDIKKEVMDEAKESIKNRPLLGFVHQLKDGSYDFAGHEMYIDPDTDEIIYEEIPVGIVPESCNPTYVYDEDLDKTYLEIDAYVFEEYTRAAEILKNKGESKVSVELALLDYGYNAQDKVMTINKFYFSGVTILGVTRDGNETPIQEGMLGSKLVLKDFSESNNSMFSELNKDNKLVEILERLNETLSEFKINNQAENAEAKNYQKGGTSDLKKENEEIKVEEEVTEQMNEEVTETESTEEVTETVTEKESESDTTPDVVEKEACGGSKDDDDKKKCSEEDAEDTEDETSAEDDKTEKFEDSEEKPEEEISKEDDEDPVKEDESKETYSVKHSVEYDGKTVSFEVSLNDTICALDRLVNDTYAETDNCYYCITVYDEHLIMDSWCGKAYKQSYKEEDGVFSLVGDRVEVHAVYVTAEEETQLDEMRANYSSIATELAQYHKAELDAKKEEIISDAAYAEFAETEEFKAVRAEMESLDEETLRTKCELAFAKCVKTKGAFSLKEEKEEVKKPAMFGFARVEQKSSFLDGLLKK